MERRVAVPARQPYGLGTGEVESFTSYVRGIATTHAVPVSWFLNVFIAKPLRDADARTFVAVQPTRATEALNGSAPGFARLVDYARHLVGQPRLPETTTRSLGQAVETREAFRRWRAWCPRCLALDGEDAYDRLYWSLRSAAVCVRHAVRLIDKCVGCGRRHRPFARLANPWSCPHCGLSLTRGAVRAPVDGVSRAAYELVTLGAGGAVPRAYGSRRVIAAAERAGNSRRLAAVLGVSVSTISLLLRARSRPHLDLLVRLEAWLATGHTDQRRRRRSRGLTSATQQSVELAVTTRSLTSLRALAASCGTTPASLKVHLPNLCTAIRDQRRRAIHDRAAQRRSDRAAIVVAALERLRREHSPITRRRLEALLPASGWLRDAELRAMWTAAGRNRERRTARNEVGSTQEIGVPERFMRAKALGKRPSSVDGLTQ